MVIYDAGDLVDTLSRLADDENLVEFTSILFENEDYHKEIHLQSEHGITVLRCMINAKFPIRTIEYFMEGCRQSCRAAEDSDDEDDLPPRSFDGRTVVHFAMMAGVSPAVLTPLLRWNLPFIQGGTLLKDLHGNTPLALALWSPYPNEESIEVLLKAYPSIAAADLHLHFAAISERVPTTIVTAIINAAPQLATKLDRLGMAPLHHVCADPNSSVEKISAILNAAPDVIWMQSSQGNTPLDLLWNTFNVSMNNNPLTADEWSQFTEGLTYSPSSLFHHASVVTFLAKTNMILRVGTKTSGMIVGGRHRKMFRTIDAAATVGRACPWKMFDFLLRLHFVDINSRDEEGMMQLHIVAAAPMQRNVSANADETAMQVCLGRCTRAVEVSDNSGKIPLHFAASRKSTTGDEIEIAQLVAAFPRGASIPDRRGRLPLHLALANARTWTTGVEILFRAYPQALGIRDPTTGDLPFVLAACRHAELSTIFEILRADPSQLADTAGETGQDPEPEVVSLKRRNEELEREVTKLRRIPKEWLKRLELETS